jgi:hypothetical protein
VEIRRTGPASRTTKGKRQGLSVSLESEHRARAGLALLMDETSKTPELPLAQNRKREPDVKSSGLDTPQKVTVHLLFGISDNVCDINRRY